MAEPNFGAIYSAYREGLGSTPEQINPYRLNHPRIVQAWEDGRNEANPNKIISPGVNPFPNEPDPPGPGYLQDGIWYKPNGEPYGRT